MKITDARHHNYVIQNNIGKLSLIDWNEVMSFVPESTELLDEITKRIQIIKNSSDELQSFFE